MVLRHVPRENSPPGLEDGSPTEVDGLDGLTGRELAVVRRRIAELKATGLSTEKSGQAALIEVAIDYWVKAVLKGVIRSAEGKKDTRAMRSFERALTEASRLADPVKKLLAQLNVDSVEVLTRMVLAFQHAERHTTEDRLEAACQIVDGEMASDPDSRERIARRFGFRSEGRNGDS